MPTPSPIIAPMVGAALETSMALASRAIPPRPTATATRVSAIGSSAATIVPKATTSTTRAASRPAASAPDVSVSALMKAASPPSSAATPAARAGAIASATAVSGAGPSSVAGRSKAISAKPTRPSGDTVPGATGSSVNDPPAVPASPRTMAAATAHIPMVAHGLRALASPMRRVTRCMTVLLRWSGSDGGRRRWRRGTTLIAGAGGVARPRTGWPSPARRVVAGPRRPVAPRTAGTRIRPEMDDRAPGLAYRGSMPADQPRRFRGPFARWPRAADAALAVAVFLATVFLVDGPGDAIVVRPVGDVPIPALLVFAVASAALYRRRHAPLAVLGVALVAWALTLGSGYADLGGVAIIALYSAGRYATNDRWERLGVAAAVVVVILDGLLDPVPWGEILFGAVVMFVAWYVGRRLRLRRERADELLREQAAEARRIVVEERTRIARELHDVVAHRVSLMTVQAGAAKAVAAEDPEGALRAMGAVEEAGRQALDELRHLLGVLRPEADHDGLGPQPGLADLPRLVEQTRGAGLDVSLATDGVPARLPARVDLFAYRIVQEALTNVLKHAGPGARTEVRLGTEPGGIVIEVLDDGRGAAVLPGSDGAAVGARGHGIVGMRERALLLGGTLDARPRPGGGFRVAAHLPTGGEPA